MDFQRVLSAVNCSKSVGCSLNAQVIYISFVGFVALRPKSTAIVIAGRSIHLITFLLGRLEQAVNQ